MARYLLDTHTAMWFFNGDKKLSETSKNVILDLSNTKYLSIASAWELSIKITLEKLEFAGKAAGFIRLAEANGIIMLPIKPEHFTTLESLPMIHRDPFDRLLIASTLAEEITLITDDNNIARYDVPQVW